MYSVISGVSSAVSHRTEPTSDCVFLSPAADLSTDSQSISSEVSLTSGSPGSSAELDSLVTVGATEATPYKCCFCDQAYPRQTLMKLHEQVSPDFRPERQ